MGKWTFAVALLAVSLFAPNRAEASVACFSGDYFVKGTSALIGAAVGIPAYFADDSRVALSGGLSRARPLPDSSSTSTSISTTSTILGLWEDAGYEVFWSHVHAAPTDCKNLSTGSLAGAFAYRVLRTERHRLRTTFGIHLSGTNQTTAVGPALGLSYKTALGPIRIAPVLRYLPTLVASNDGLKAPANIRGDLRLQYRSNSMFEPFLSGIAGSVQPATAETSSYATYFGGELGLEARW